MIPSVAPLVFSGLVDQLRLVAELADVQISSGPLGRGTEKESIQLFGTQPADEEWAALGNRTKDETFEIVGGVYVQRLGSSEESIRETRDRAYQLLGYVATFLRSDHKMHTITAGAADGVIALTSSDMTQGTNSDGRWIEIDMRISVRARLRSS